MTTTTLDHTITAQKLDHLYAVAADLDRELAAAGLRSWQGPRVHLLQAHAELHHLRHALDTLAIGEGIASPYVLRPVAAAPKVPACEITGPSWEQRDTGDDDRLASLLNGPLKGPSSATPATPAPLAGLSMPLRGHVAAALTSSPRASEPV